MDTLLVVGTDSVVGANIAATLSDRWHVVGLSVSDPVNIDGCENASCRAANDEAIRGWIARTRPLWVVLCPLPARSLWRDAMSLAEEDRATALARGWILAATEAGCRLALISSDAVFTGPWMFHDEKSRCYCSSRTASTLREIEEFGLAQDPKPLIVRTNAFGWSPHDNGAGWVDESLDWIERKTNPFPDCHSYSTPILASDLAEILDRAFQKPLAGTFHVAGAERVSPAQFVQRFARQSGRNVPRINASESLSERPVGFGRGEASLQTRKIRRALRIGMPTLADGLERLLDQDRNGYRERLNSAVRPSKVA